MQKQVWKILTWKQFLSQNLILCEVWVDISQYICMIYVLIAHQSALETHWETIYRATFTPLILNFKISTFKNDPRPQKFVWKKSSPRKKFYFKFRRFKASWSFSDKKNIFWKFFFSDFGPPSCQKKKIQVFLTHEIPSETPWLMVWAFTISWILFFPE